MPPIVHEPKAYPRRAAGLKARNPCTTRPIGSVRNLTEKVKTEIPAYTLESLRIASIVEDARGQERLQQKEEASSWPFIYICTS